MTTDLDAPDLPPEHPGAILRRDFLDTLGLSANALALALRVPAPRISELVRGRRGVTPDTALRLARYFGTTAEFWMGLQAAHDLHLVREAEGARIEAEVDPADIDEKSVRKTVKKRKAALKHSV